MHGKDQLYSLTSTQGHKLKLIKNNKNIKAFFNDLKINKENLKNLKG